MKYKVTLIVEQDNVPVEMSFECDTTEQAQQEIDAILAMLF